MPTSRTPPGKRRLTPTAQRARSEDLQRRGWGKLLEHDPFTTLTTVKQRRAREYATEQERAARCLRVGTAEKRYTGQGIESRGGPSYCLTESQWKRLQPGRRLGCGSFGCAYERPDGAVVKLTWDASDIAAMKEGQGHRRVVKLYEAFRLPPMVEPGWEREPEARRMPPAYAAVVERLAPLPIGGDLALWADLVHNRKEFLRENFDVASGSEGELPFGRNYVVRPHYRETLLADVCDRPHMSAPRLRACRRFVGEVIRTHEHLGRRGFNFFDVAPRNIGVDGKGDWKFLDVGYSSDERKPRVNVLRGPPSGRRRKGSPQ